MYLLLLIIIFLLVWLLEKWHISKICHFLRFLKNDISRRNVIFHEMSFFLLCQHLAQNFEKCCCWLVVYLLWLFYDSLFYVFVVLKYWGDFGCWLLFWLLFCELYKSPAQTSSLQTRVRLECVCFWKLSHFPIHCNNGLAIIILFLIFQVLLLKPLNLCQYNYTFFSLIPIQPWMPP